MSTKPIWFRWELDFACRWRPVAYHADKPKVVTSSEGDPQRMTDAQPVPPEAIGEDGEPMFGKLVELFPAPRDE